MSFDICLIEKESDVLKTKPVLVFEEAYYWFLFNFSQEFHKVTGIYIDLYGLGLVKGNNLLILKDMIGKETSKIKKMEQNLKSCEGSDAEGNKLYLYFKRDDIVNFLSRLSELCDIAFKENKILAFEGD